MRRRNLDLLIAVGIAVANVVWALLAMLTNLTSLAAINIILALPLVFVAPGYALSETLFPRRTLEPVQRMAFTLALSLAVTIISGFILNLLPSGLRLLPWVLWLGLLTLLFSLLAYMRRHRLEEEEPVDMTIVVPTQRFRVQISALILFGLAILVVVLSVIYSVVGAEQQSHPGFTNLWMLQATQGTNTCAVSIGMQSFELTVVTYRIVVTTNSAQTASWSGISLTPQQQWAHLQPIPVGTNTAVTVLVQVYRLDQPQTVYLHTHILLHVTTKGTAKECTSA